METKVIMLVEDNEDDIALTLRAFRKNNVRNQVVVVRDGVEALDYLHGRNGQPRDRPMPELVLLDLQLPRMNGLEVLQRLRADDRTRFLPVVILTSSTEDRDLVESYSLGANSYVRKPVDFTDFVQAVGQLELYWLVLNEPAPRM